MSPGELVAEVQALPPADRVKLVQAVIQQLYDELEVEAVQLDALETGTARVPLDLERFRKPSRR